jgi:hypothetical protein
MSEEDLDVLYTQTCRALTSVGPERSELFLARLALLLMHEVGDFERVQAAIAAAGATLDTPSVARS